VLGLGLTAKSRSIVFTELDWIEQLFHVTVESGLAVCCQHHVLYLSVIIFVVVYSGFFCIECFYHSTSQIALDELT
jgi:Ni,Fe-hydrogenase I cytochrome b subunit